MFWLKRAYLATRKYLDDDLMKYGLTASQLDVLMYLWHDDGMEHRLLQERLGVTSPTLTSIIDVMVERGYVERRMSPDDARVKQLFVTHKGWQLSEQLAEVRDRFSTQMLATFSPREAALFVEWLQQVAQNMGDNYRPPRLP